MNSFVSVPSSEMTAIFSKLKAAMDLKYKIMDVIQPCLLIGSYGPNSPMVDINKENRDKLQKIMELVRDYKP